ncbi:hypothetical protein [Lewinella cohaerens]|uniref:hypothetical protein n=1 Tax=Lewinella cohaerens TaxID=70995 RepID=UPI00037A774F|nr:hypothetical protein [Lewinella cohaerens]
MSIKNALLSLFAFLSFYGMNAQAIISHQLRVADSTQLHALFTADGHQFFGLTQYIHDDTVGFQIRNLSTTKTFLLSNISFLGLATASFSTVEEPTPVEPEDEEWIREKYPMPLNQLLYSATAIPYASKGTYRNTMILVNQVDSKISKNFSFSGGALVPALLMGRLQAHASASDMLHIGLAVQQYVILWDEQSATHPYAMVTVGQRDRYLNFTMGYWIDRYGFRSSDHYPMVTLGGSFAFAQDWRFFVEGAAVFQTYDNLMLPSFNFSNRRRKSVLEFGVLAIPDTDFPLLPLLSYQRIF